MTLVRVVAQRKFQESYPGYSALRANFEQYKRTGIAPSLFGRDAPYHQPAMARAAGLMHLHLLTTPIVGVTQYRRTSDIHLVYCEHAIYKNVFALIAVLNPNAHAQANDVDAMISLSAIAERFHQQNF